jgi:hypothetical protein
MRYSIRQLDEEHRFCDCLTLDALVGVVTPTAIDEALRETGRRHQRHRKLTFAATVLLTIAMNIFTDESVGGVFARLAQGLRLLWADPDLALPRDSALSMRRYQLGPRPLVALFRRICRPIATEATTGAFVSGLRVMALDGSKEVVPDTVENAAAFGKSSNAKGLSAFPHIHGVYLVECATHAIVDAGLWSCNTNERTGAFRLVRSIDAGMLVLMDAGFYGFRLIAALARRGAEVLCRMPGHIKPTFVELLSDGSVLAKITDSDVKKPGPDDEMVARVITYTVPDPKHPEQRTTCRLLTTLLDEIAWPALEIVCLYHERWEIELVFDEIGTHQRLVSRPLRSLLPLGVIQEFYALLIAHFVIRFLMHQAGMQAGVDPRRLSFVAALRSVRQAIPEFQIVAPEQHGQLYGRLLRDIARARLPERPTRRNPRVVKRQQSKFKRKRPVHRASPPPPLPFRDLVILS